MARVNSTIVFLVVLIFLSLCTPTSAFGAGNIASISRIEGKNWRHGDIEDTLKAIAFLKGKKWTTMMIKRVYFGNWLRDYSQAVDVATISKVQGSAIRVLVWILSFLSFGYATAEFEVTDERLGTYRPEEHIDNPRDYADNQDARKYDPRLRPPVQPIELAIDPRSGKYYRVLLLRSTTKLIYVGMKNYIANESGQWATSSGYIKHSFARSIHFGRVYTSGAHGTKGKEEDLCEALRCLGQALHTLEDFGAHTNYVELALREMGYRNVFTHTGTATEIMVQGKRIFPLVTGTFGGVDFLHSVLGEATDHMTQSEIDEMDVTLGEAQAASQRGGDSSSLGGFCDMLSMVPGTDSLISEAQSLQATSDAEQAANEGSRGFSDDTYSTDRASNMSIPGYQAGAGDPNAALQNLQNIDPEAVIKKIYPILAFRDKVVRTIDGIVAKIPGLENLIQTITEGVTLFVLSLLAPFIRPIIQAATASLKVGSSSVVSASGRHQYEPWTDPVCTDPTHSLLSKDHFSNILNDPAGQVAAVIVKYVAPRIVYAWQHPDVPLNEVLNDVVRVFHHPALRNNNLEIHRNMFAAVSDWVQRLPDRGGNLNDVLSSASVKAGKNHQAVSVSDEVGFKVPGLPGLGSHSKVSGSPFDMLSKMRGETGFDIGGFGESSARSVWASGSSYQEQIEPVAPSEPVYQPSYGQQSWEDQQPQAQDREYAYEGTTGYQQSYDDDYSSQVQQQPPSGTGAYEEYESYQGQQYYPTQGSGQSYYNTEYSQGQYGQY